MKQPNLDHVVIAVSAFERSNRFYAEVLGAEVVELRRGRWLKKATTPSKHRSSMLPTIVSVELMH